MAEYLLHCFAQSGNAYKPALALELAEADWAPRFVDYFNGETRSPAYRALQRDGRGSDARASRRALVPVRRHPRLSRGNARPVRSGRCRRAARDPALALLGQPQAYELHRHVSLHAHLRRGSGPGGAGRISPPGGNGVGRAQRASRKADVCRRRAADDRRYLARRLSLLRRRDRHRLERCIPRCASGSRGSGASRAGCIPTR